jgi:signal transduction histidine kinase
MKFKNKLSFFNALTTLAGIGIFILAIPFVIDFIAIHQTDKELFEKKEKVLEIITYKGISGFTDNEEEVFGSYNLLKEEYFLIENYYENEPLQFIENTQRIVDGELIDYRVITYTAKVNNQSYLIEIGKSLSTIGNIDTALQLFALILLSSMFFLSIIANYFYTRHLLRPFKKIIRQKLNNTGDPAAFDFTSIQTSTADFKLMDDTINDMMRRIKDAFSKEREFTANVSHELLTPISILQNRLENLLNDEQAHHHIKVKLADSLPLISRLKNIINSLLTISRIENEHYIKTETADIKEIIEEAAAEVTERYAEKNISFSCEFSGKMILKNCHKQLLHTLFTNLLSNAFKYNKTGGSVMVRGINEKGLFKLQITDTGHGIDQENLTKLFSRFKRFDSEKREGHGLGLAIAKAIADLHKFNIEYQSETGKGTEVSLIIPSS